MNSSQKLWPSVLIIAVIAICGGIVRGLLASQEFLWLDELHTSWVVHDGFQEVLGRSVSGNQSPLFFWLSWIPVWLMGESTFSIRLVSLLSGVGTVFAGGYLVLRWTRSTLGAVVVAILIALDFQFLYYGTEARPYSLIQLLSAVQVMLFWHWIEPNNPSGESKLNRTSTGTALSVALVSGLLIYTHYTSIWLMLTEAVFIGTWMTLNGNFRRRIWRSSLWSIAMLGLLCLPALFMMKSVFSRRVNWAPVASIGEVLNDFLGLNTHQVSPLVCWILFPLIILLFVGLIRRLRNLNLPPDSNHKSFQNSKLGFVFLWATMPVVAVIAIDYFGIAPTALPRYTLVGSVAFPIFAGLAIGFCKDRKVQMGLGILLIAASFIQSPITSSNYLSSGFNSSELPGLRFEDWQTPVEFINSDQSKRNQPVFLAANLIEDVDALTDLEPDFQEYLLFPLKGIHQVDPNRNLIPIPTLAREHFDERHIRMIKEAGGAWIVIRATEELAVDLATEFESEIRGKSQLLDRQAELNSNLHGSPYSNVYLLSVDW